VNVIKSRPAGLADIGVPNAPRRCPRCRRKVGGRFIALYTGTPADKTLVGWRCTQCGTEFELEP
jgi:hypothetical protein